MLGPLTIMSLDQGRLYGKVRNPEELLWLESSTSTACDEATADIGRKKPMPESRTFLHEVRDLLLRIVRRAYRPSNFHARDLTGH